MPELLSNAFGMTMLAIATFAFCSREVRRAFSDVFALTGFARIWWRVRFCRRRCSRPSAAISNSTAQ